MIVIGWPLGVRFFCANAIVEADDVSTWWESYLLLFEALVACGLSPPEATRLALGE